MKINIVGLGEKVVEQLQGLEHFVVVETGEVLHLAKNAVMDVWHVVAVVKAAVKPEKANTTSNTVTTDTVTANVANVAYTTTS
jgi:hypothetical protein